MYMIINIHCQGLSHGISSPTNITLLKYSGDDVGDTVCELVSM
jgi:hypothetical protein